MGKTTCGETSRGWVTQLLLSHKKISGNLWSTDCIKKMERVLKSEANVEISWPCGEWPYRFQEEVWENLWKNVSSSYLSYYPGKHISNEFVNCGIYSEINSVDSVYVWTFTFLITCTKADEILFSSLITCAHICADDNPTLMDHCAVRSLHTDQKLTLGQAAIFELLIYWLDMGL